MSTRVQGVARLWRHVRPIEALLVGALALYAASLTLFPRVWRRWPLRSHYYYQNKDLFDALISNGVPLLLTLGALVLLTWRRRRISPGVLVALFACAVSLQWSLSFLEGLNARRLSSTLVAPQYGHSEFLLRAEREEHPLDLARTYEQRCAAEEGRSYAKSKPPGHLLFYVLTARLYSALPIQGAFEWLAEHGGFASRGTATALGAFTTLVFSLVSGLPVIVLSVLGARLEKSARAGVTYGLVFLLSPAIALVTMHLDQVLYPLLVSLVLLAAVLALERHAALGALAGVAVYGSLYVSFSLLFLVPTVGLWWGAHFAFRSEQRRRVVMAGTCFLLGALAAYALLRFGLSFEIGLAYRRAMEQHAAWRGPTGLIGVAGTTRNLVEAAVWLGLPAAILAVRHYLRSSARVWRGPDPVAVFCVCYPLIVIAVSVFGHATREIGRLWIPMLIPAQLVVAREVNRLYPRRPTIYLLLAAATLLLAKNYHDIR